MFDPIHMIRFCLCLEQNLAVAKLYSNDSEYYSMNLEIQRSKNDATHHNFYHYCYFSRD